MVLKEENSIVHFVLEDKDGFKHKSDLIKSDFIILYFYPKDNTEGCTIEAKEFTTLHESFRAINASIIGISGGDRESKKKFCEKNHLGIALLSDSDFSISKKYGVYGEKNFLGKKYNGIYRTTFVIDKERKIIKVYEKVKPLGHAKEVLNYLKTIK